MTKKYNQALPFIVLAIVGLTLYAEVTYEIEIDINEYIPVLTAIGVGGAAIKVAEKAGAMRKALPANIEKLIKDDITKLKNPR